MPGIRKSVTPEDGTDISSRNRSNVFLQSLVVTRTMDFWGRTGGLSVVLPYAFANTSSSSFQASTNGVSDVGFLWQMNIFGGPALTREQFPSFVPQTFSSFHLYVGTPLGTYNATSPINPSANRWMISPTINYSYTPDRGWTWLETYVTGLMFTNNNDFLVNGSQTLSQSPIFRLEGHASRNLTDGLWLSADAYYNVGGETSIDGIEQDNMANTLRVGAGHGTAALARRGYSLNYERVVAKPAANRIRKRYALRSGSSGETRCSAGPTIRRATRRAAGLCRGQLYDRQLGRNIRAQSSRNRSKIMESKDGGTPDSS